VKTNDPITQSERPITLADMASQYFKFDPLAKMLYAKLNLDTAIRVDY
jgi:hypothetical protein